MNRSTLGIALALTGLSLYSLDALAGAKPAIMRAFQAAKTARMAGRELSDDCVERGDEFRLLLLYLRRERAWAGVGAI